MKVTVELDEDDCVLIGHTLRSLAHTSLADASAAERLERVGSAMVAAKPTSPPEHDSWRTSALSAIVELEAKIAAQGPLVEAAATWAEAEKALALANAAATACEDALDAAKGDAEAKRRSDNASLWYITCARDEEKAAKAMRDAARRLIARAKFHAQASDVDPDMKPEYDFAKGERGKFYREGAKSILRIVLGDACVVAESIAELDAHGVGGWRFACQSCDATWAQPDSSDATAIAHMLMKHAISASGVCVTSIVRSCVCGRGTKGCNVQHAMPGADADSDAEATP